MRIWTTNHIKANRAVCDVFVVEATEQESATLVEAIDRVLATVTLTDTAIQPLVEFRSALDAAYRPTGTVSTLRETESIPDCMDTSKQALQRGLLRVADEFFRMYPDAALDDSMLAQALADARKQFDRRAEQERQRNHPLPPERE